MSHLENQNPAYWHGCAFRHRECIHYPDPDAETGLCGRTLVERMGDSKACTGGTLRKKEDDDGA